MARSVETTHRTAEIALAALKKLGLAASPRNFEVWFTHAEGKNPALSRDIQRCMGTDGAISQMQVDGLYDLHIVRADLSRDVMDIVTRFESEIVSLNRLIESTGQSAQGHGEELQKLSGELRTSAEQYPSVGKLLEGVIAVTRSVREENQKLEQRLAASSDEVATLRLNVEHIQLEAMTDPLTGVKNRKSFDTALQKMTRHARDKSEPLALVIADVDHFKTFNDKWGHQTGDQVLRLVAEVMNANVKGQDLLARYGGEEFAILLPGTSLDNGRMLADRIRKAVESRRLKKRRTDEDLGVVTMSMGVSLFRPEETSEAFIERADECLYAAKRGGRNQVVAEGAAERIAKSA